MQKQVTGVSPLYGLLANRVYVQRITAVTPGWGGGCLNRPHNSHPINNSRDVAFKPQPSAAKCCTSDKGWADVCVRSQTRTVRLFSWSTARDLTVRNPRQIPRTRRATVQSAEYRGFTSATVSWEALAQFMAVTLCGHVRTWHSDDAALHPCPLFLYCSDLVFCEMKVMFGPEALLATMAGSQKVSTSISVTGMGDRPPDSLSTQSPS